MNDPWMPFLAAAVGLVLLLLTQRWIHAHLHGVSLLLTGRPDWALYVYALVLLPGVILHEVSHFLAARMMGVRTGGISVMPRRQPDGTLQLGYVEYYRGRMLDPMRESLIGGAPLITGTLAIWLIANRVFGVTNLTAAVQTGDVSAVAGAMSQFVAAPAFLVWLYFLFAIGNAMLPSKSDRHAWPAFLLFLMGLTMLIAFATRGSAMMDDLARPVATFFLYLATALFTAFAVNVLFFFAITAAEWLLSRARGMSVVYSGQVNEQ